MKDKTIIKVAGILGIIFGIIACLTIIGIIIGIPMIIGGKTFCDFAVKTDEEIYNERSTILGWSIFFILFSTIPGILGLIYFFGVSDSFVTSNDNSKFDELKKLKELYDTRVITKEEYETKRKDLLDKI